MTNNTPNILFKLKFSSKSKILFLCTEVKLIKSNNNRNAPIAEPKIKENLSNKEVIERNDAVFKLIDPPSQKGNN
jgi:hypothetical protein